MLRRNVGVDIVQEIGGITTIEDAKKLFEEVGPACEDRQGGYCRITKLRARMSDSAPMAYIEWTDIEDMALASLDDDELD